VLQTLQSALVAPVQPSQETSHYTHVLTLRKWVALHSVHSEINGPVHLVQAESHGWQVVDPSW
jgi:hypothetical protein